MERQANQEFLTIVSVIFSYNSVYFSQRQACSLGPGTVLRRHYHAVKIA